MSRLFKCRRRGLTLIEVVIASLFISMIGTMMTTGMIFAMRMQRNNMQVARMTQLSRHFVARFADDVRRASAATIDPNGPANGTVIQLTIPNAAGGGTRVSQFQYLDLDNNPLTIQDNIIRYDANVNDANNATVDVVKYVSPVSGTNVFQYISGERTVQVTIRFGDNNESAQAKAASDVLTGPGLQMIIIRTSFQHRNR